MFVFTIGELSSFCSVLKETGKYDIESLDSFMPVCKSHEEYETVVQVPGFFSKQVNSSPENVDIVINPTESSGITLVFVHELLSAGKKVTVHILGKWRKNTIPNRYMFRVVFGILQQKALITENLNLVLFPQDVYSLTYKGSVMEENSEMQKVFAQIFHTKNVFTNSAERVVLSGEFSGGYDSFMVFDKQSKVSCLSKVGIDQINMFQTELQKMMKSCDLGCEIIRRDFYHSGEEVPNEKVERFLNDQPQIVNNLKFYSLGKAATLFEVFFV